MGIVEMIAVTLGASWAAGINLYATVAALGIAGRVGLVALPAGWETLTHPLVIVAAILMYVVEFVADKAPYVDTGWDAIHTFIRIPAGAILAYAAVDGAGIDPALALAAGLVGGTLAAGSHAAKASTRALVNTSPEPFTNAAVSVGEDVIVIGGVTLALWQPWVFLALLGLWVALLIWLLPRLWRALKGLVARLRRKPEPAPTGPPPQV